MIGKRLRKIIEQLILIYCILKEKKICPTYISNINLNCEKKKTIIDSKWRKRRLALSCSKKSI